MIRCPGHHFNGPIESLTGDSTDTRDPGTAGLGSRAGRDSLRGSNDDRHGGGFAPRDLLTEPGAERPPPEHRPGL